MSKPQLLVFVLLACMVVALSTTTHAAQTDTLFVDVLGPTRPLVRPVATGWLGNLPNTLPDSLIVPLKPSCVRASFHRDLGGSLFSGSWDKVDSAGAIAMMNLWPVAGVDQSACGCPSGQYGDSCSAATRCIIDAESSCWTEYLNDVVGEVADELEAHPGLRVQWSIWNEPDACDFWGDHPDSLYEAEYFELYRVSYDSLVTMPGAVVTGPGYTHDSPLGAAGRFLLKDFMEYAHSIDRLPHRIAWHYFPEPEYAPQFLNLEWQAQTLRDALKTWNVDSTYADTVRFVVDETLEEDMYLVAGRIVRIFATSERAVDDGLEFVNRANWDLAELPFEAGLLTTQLQKRYAWWLYKEYASLASSDSSTLLLEEVQPAGPNGGDYDALAVVDADSSRVRILVGRFNNQAAAAPDVLTLKVSNLDGLGLVDAVDFEQNLVQVTARRFRAGATYNKQAPIAEQDLAVPSLSRRFETSNGDLVIHFSGTHDFNDFDAYLVEITAVSRGSVTASQ